MTTNTFGYKPPCMKTMRLHLIPPGNAPFFCCQRGFAASAGAAAPLVGSRQSQAATAAQQTAGTQHQAGGNWKPATTEPTAIITVASCLARSGTARFARQSSIHGPKRGCPSSQRSQRALPREKQKAASSTKGTVGSNGRKMPTKPAPRLSQPAASHKSFSSRPGSLGERPCGLSPLSSLPSFIGSPPAIDRSPRLTRSRLCYNPPFPEMPWPLSVACAGKPHLTPARRSHHDEKNYR